MWCSVQGVDYGLIPTRKVRHDRHFREQAYPFRRECSIESESNVADAG